MKKAPCKVNVSLTFDELDAILDTIDAYRGLTVDLAIPLIAKLVKAQHKVDALDAKRS